MYNLLHIIFMKERKTQFNNEDQSPPICQTTEKIASKVSHPFRKASSQSERAVEILFGLTVRFSRSITNNITHTQFTVIHRPISKAFVTRRHTQYAPVFHTVNCMQVNLAGWHDPRAPPHNNDHHRRL